mmetsp:Transcript_10537/g.18508  ORF Transcript_10537/g.18508 Transcript_10537/m.18508 type:complete len:267 (+) Transcript_10537:101-901(+)|eukprot:CAMPEP_0183736546 /NCGR_PEP_ID=MMETSP0737-20130205/49542_1 /TAXON_ID=385413 /ORGANISM="Thalassiosira miniscula, Strain CCMP1093" /LENGTH=266 /DNA_ID=CAMNT_0025970571 /DNA_START=179 /DNA_END=979 /DNA_ORIENTATION=+
MVSFLQSSAAVTAALLASLSSTNAYGRIYFGSRPTMALGNRMQPTRSRPSLFSRGIARTIHDMDEMVNSMLGGMDEMFYEPFALQRISRPSYLLQEKPAKNALSQGMENKNALGITQDDKQVQFAVEVPGAKASDINLQLDEDGRVLKISGETKREEGGISVHSRFERSFTLNRDIDTSRISARMDDGVLTITAPKYEEVKETVRRIEVAEDNKIEDEKVVEEKERVDASISHEENEKSPKSKDESQTVKPESDESLIDLDKQEQA